MTSVGVRQLKAGLSRYLQRVRAGERITVTARGRPVAVLAPPAARPADGRVEALLLNGRVEWAGGKPRGTARPPRITGRPVADAVVEDRR